MHDAVTLFLAVLAGQTAPPTPPAPATRAAEVAVAPIPSVQQFVADFAAIRRETDKAEAAAMFVRWMAPVGVLSARYKQVLADDKKAGRAPRACASKGTELNFSADELVAALARLPAAEQAAPLDQAFFRFLDRRLPCRTA
jgi:hypothetical protein